MTSIWRKESLNHLTENSPGSWVLPVVIVLGISLPIMGTLLLGRFFDWWIWWSITFHSILEIAGAILGLVLAIIILYSRLRTCTSRKMWVACALSSMAALDIAHSCVPVGNTFVWLHALAVLAGGLFFSLVWLPEREIAMQRGLIAMGGAFLLAVLIAMLSAIYPESLPIMMEAERYTTTAEALNFIGGGLTLLAALSFAARYHGGGNREDLLFLILCLLFGLPGVLFQMSGIWEAGWWFWHVLRLAGYILAFWLALLIYRSSEKETLKTQSELNALFQLAVDGKRLIDKDFNQIRMNETFAAMAGMDTKSEKGLKCYESFSCPLCHSHRCPLKQLKRGEIERIEHELTLTSRDGTERSFLMTATPIARADGSFRGIVESFWDITERNAAKRKLTEQNALKTAQAQLSDVMAGGLDPQTLCRNIITFLCQYVEAPIGLIHLAEDGGMLKTSAGYAFKNCAHKQTAYQLGEGLVGQAALSRKNMTLENVAKDRLIITSGLGDMAPRNIYLKPLVHNGESVAVIELGSFETITDSQREFLELANDTMAVAIDSAKSRHQLAVSLENSQRLSEALQSQQEALKGANQSLEQQSEELRSANEELEQQSEELRSANEELEEKSEALELQKREIVRAKGVVEEKARELESAGRYKSEFLANMSHELRTPLNSLLILAKLMAENEEGNLTQEQVESARIIHGSGQDLLLLINEILDLSKVEAGMMEMHPEKIPLETLVQSLRRQFRTVALEKGLRFDIIVAPGAPQSILTDRQRLEQILRNFLANGFKFTKKGAVTLEIASPGKNIRFASNHLTCANALAFSVRDTGPGIPKEKRQAIFEAFQQVDGSVSRRYGGTGLGLSISRALAHLLKGEIQLVSGIGSGSTFTLYLPLERRTRAAETAVLPLKEKDVPKRRTVQPRGLRASEVSAIQFLSDDRNQIKEGDRTVLIIEDDARFAELLMGYARKKNFKCLAAGDGSSGLKLATAYRPQAIILDLGLPDIDGTAVLDGLKYGLETRHIPVHVISGRSKTPEIMQKGAIGFLTKPINAEDIQNTFERIQKVLDTTVKHILIVEDDESSRKAIETLVAAKGVEITATNSGEDALRLVSDRSFDCVILDLGLPDMTGFDLLRVLNEDPALSLPPVVVYTGKELTDAELRELSQYTTKVVVKGANSPERLLDEVSLFLHTVESSLPEEQQQILRLLHDPEELLRGRKILLVDDDLRNSFALSKILKNAGLKVVLAENGQVALDVLEKERNVDMVLMDIMMPVMDGYAAMKRIRSQERFKNLPMVALTAKAMVEDRAKCIEAGANDYLAKPVDTSKLISLIRVLLYQ